MPLEQQETDPVADTGNQPKTPKRTRNVDEILPKSSKKTPSRKQMDDFTPRRSVRASTRLLNLTKPMHTGDALTSTPRNAWIESEVPSTSESQAKPEENEIALSVRKSAKKRSKSLTSTPKKEKKLTIPIEMSDTAFTTIPKSPKLCSSSTDAQGTEVLPTFERNEIDAPESTIKRGKSLIVTPRKVPTTPKTADKRSRSMAIEMVAVSKSTLSNVEPDVNSYAAVKLNTGNADISLESHIIESEETNMRDQVSGFKENNAQRFSVVDLTEISFIESESPIKTDTSEIDPVVKSASIAEFTHAVDISPLKDIRPMLNENDSINNSSLISLPDTPDMSRKPLSSLNDTFSPEVSIETTYGAVKQPTMTPVQVTPKTQFSFRTRYMLKTPLASVKRLKSSPGNLLKREQTPYKPGFIKPCNKDLRFLVASTPEKQLLEATLPLTILKSIRKRSFSVDCELPKKERQRVTFHSPANKEIPIDEIDLIMENSRREVKRDQENKRSITGYHRKRSFSNAETAKEKARPLKELNAELDRMSNTKNKIPDFAAIHKRNFDRMESIDEYKNRREERCKDLLSNQKLLTEGVAKTTDSTAQPVARKNLFDESKAAGGVIKAKASSALAPAKMVKPIISGINKLKNRQVKNKEAYKAGSNKPKASEAVAVENKNILRGVRTNRRFDLQMKFRNNIDQD